MFSIGQLVYSKNGRDKGFAFIVVGIEDGYVYIADGKRRKLNKPKKKKIIHVQRVNRIDLDIKNKIESGAFLMDSDIRSALCKLTNCGSNS